MAASLRCRITNIDHLEPGRLVLGARPSLHDPRAADKSVPPTPSLLSLVLLEVFPWGGSVPVSAPYVVSDPRTGAAFWHAM